ncbi:MAG: hypothetical protein QGM50_09335 [Anaerolineae bacterium]|nr:hypothetical protein [Anaerolineae bacterium]MDK1082179.1 hypothetical protein [Anaerolineae bacterium]MDK1118977.1 hypothetical protein [Anaerolineae bacterium]
MKNRLWILGLLLFGLVACGTTLNKNSNPSSESLSANDQPPESLPTAVSLPDLGLAPELTNDIWLNVDAPLRLADLRGKVVGLAMWTFG